MTKVVKPTQMLIFALIKYLKMKRLLILALGLLALSCQESKKSSGNGLEATIENVDDGTNVYVSVLENGQPVPIDTVEVQNGKISIDLPKVDTQTLDILTVEGIPGNMFFFNENKALTATVYKDSLRNSPVKGGPANELFTDYISQMTKNSQELMDMTKNYTQEDFQDSTVKAEVMKKQKEIQDKNTAYSKKVIKEHSDLLPSIFILSDLMRSESVPYTEQKELFNNLSSELKESALGKQISQQLEASKATAVGNKAPEFSAKTPEGEELALKDALGKYTLIDFWASWCKPCRIENPSIVKAYEKYHDKGFNILGVSLDKNKKNWIKAIEDDNLSWQQISNLKYWQDPIAQEYQVRAIPANYLLDEDGMIVAKDLRGEALSKKLEKLLGDK